MSRKVFHPVISIFLVLLTVFLVSFESLHAHHDCPGESCPVCTLIVTVRVMLSSLAVASLIKFFSVEKGNIFYRARIFPASVLNTLVTQKIRLND